MQHETKLVTVKKNSTNLGLLTKVLIEQRPPFELSVGAVASTDSCSFPYFSIVDDLNLNLNLSLDLNPV